MASSFSRWIHRAVTTLFLLAVVAFGLMMPADCIIQASNSPNDALNTFIVVGAVALILILCILLAIGRVLIHRSCMQDIPKRYVPITDRDLLHNGCMEEITKHMNLTHALTKEFKKPANRVVHDGMEPPLSEDYVHDEKIPPLLNYETCVKIVADRFKFQGVFINNAQLLPPLSSTFSQQVQSQFLTQDGEYFEQTQKYIELYETIRFSGRPITREQLIQFMELSLFFFDLSVTMDNKPPGYVAEVPNFVSLTTRTDSNISDTSSDYRTTADIMGSSEWALHNSSTNETVTMNLTFPYNRGGAAGASEVVLEFRNSSSLESMPSVIRR